MKAIADALPAGCLWSGFGLSRMEMPMVAQAMLLGGNVRVGLEDNLYLTGDQMARSNGELVAKAVQDGQPALGITDHGNMYGVLDFYRAAPSVWPGTDEAVRDGYREVRGG